MANHHLRQRLVVVDNSLSGSSAFSQPEPEQPQPPEPSQPSIRQALISLDEFHLSDFFKEVLKCYKWSLLNHPVLTKSITSATIAIWGEIIASYVKYTFSGGKSTTRTSSSSNNSNSILSYKRIGIFGLYGLLCSGPMLHYWYTYLEYILTCKMNLSGTRKIAAKLLIDRCMWAPPFVLFTITFLQLLQTLSPHKTAEAIRKSYVAVLLMNQKVWVPAQSFNFTVVPVEYQVLFVNLISVGWNTFLSMSQ